MPSITVQRAMGAVLIVISTQIASVSALDAQASPTATISGRVQDPAGNPLPTARIVIAELGRSATTSADGTFAFRNVRPGTYHIDATLLGYAPGHEEVNIPEGEGQAVARVVLTLRITPLALSGVQVTASIAAEDPLRITQSTVQLTGKELARNIGATVAQTLSRQPGIATRYAGPGPSVPVIRGFTGERILVLQDGQRAGDLSATSADHGLSVDPLAAMQIEVVRGPASLLYGNNALGGVVNVVSHDIPTSVPGGWDGYVAAQGESVNPGGALSGSVALPLGQSFALTVHGGWRSIDDVRTGEGGRLDNTQFDSRNGTLGVGYVTDDLSAGIGYRVFDFDYGLPASPDDEEAGIRIDGIRHEATGRAELTLASSAFTNLRLNGSAQWYRHDEVEPDGAIGTTFDLKTQTVNVLTRTRFGPFTGAVGVSGLFEQYAPTGEEALTPPADSRSAGILLFQEVPISGRSSEMAPRIQVGARYDWYRIKADEGGTQFRPARSRAFRNVSGSVGLNVPLNTGMSASLSLARAFRAPTVEELFSNAFHAALGSFDIGNPDLAAETNQGIEGVLRAQNERVSAQAAAYYNWIDNYIAPNIVGDTVIVDEGETSVVPLNVFQQADAQVRGVEAQIEATILDDVVLGVMGDLIRGTYFDGSPLPFLPTARIGGSARWDNGRYSLGAEMRHAIAQDDVPENEFATGAYTLVDLSAGLMLTAAGRVHSIMLRTDNVFDVLYREPTSRIKEFAANPGRNVTLVYRMLF